MPDATLPARHVFVYGTLRRGDDNDITRLVPAPEFLGHAEITGVMYHLGAYPGVILAHAVSGQDVGLGRIIGEVYAIQAALEQTLDEIETVYPQQRDEYFKRDIQVIVGGRTLTCIVYEINPAYAQGKPVIGSGDWVKDRRNDRSGPSKSQVLK
jgi:gamma-glutamylcyclotransferase (GGCT)/AIG2-like uncharacterized protein YtfP